MAETLIRFKDGFVIKPDGTDGWAIYREAIRTKNPGKGEVYYVALGYHASVASALNSLLNRRLIQSGAQSIADLAQEILSFRQELAEIFKVPHGHG